MSAAVDIWELLRGIGRRGENEPLMTWLGRLARLVPCPPPPTPEEWRSIQQIPPCHLCGATVLVTERGRLDVTHDYRLHHPERVGRAAPVKAPERGGYGSSVRDALRRGGLFGERA